MNLLVASISEGAIILTAYGKLRGQFFIDKFPFRRSQFLGIFYAKGSEVFVVPAGYRSDDHRAEHGSFPGLVHPAEHGIQVLRQYI